MKIAIDYLLVFSHFWFATPQLVLQADWQEVWHSPQPPFLALSHRLRVSRVLILSIICISDLLNSNGFPGGPPADSHLKTGKILAYHPHKVKIFQQFDYWAHFIAIKVQTMASLGAPPPGCRSGQREVQAAEKLVVKHGGALGCEQRHILDDFLSVDSGQPLSGWFSLKSILPKRGSAFYINGVIFGFSMAGNHCNYYSFGVLLMAVSTPLMR